MRMVKAKFIVKVTSGSCEDKKYITYLEIPFLTTHVALDVGAKAILFEVDQNLTIYERRFGFVILRSTIMLADLLFIFRTETIQEVIEAFEADPDWKEYRY